MDSHISPRYTLVAFAVVAILLIGGAVLLLSSRPEPVQITINPPIPTATAEPTATPSPIFVYVTGAVAQPETTVEVPHGSRVIDAIVLAGDFTEDADQTRVNLAGILRDGDHVHVPSLVIADESNTNAILPTPSGGTVVYINTATLEELQTLPGVGPAMAQRIIDYREENGALTSLDDLDNISGIGESTLSELSDLIAFD